MKIDNSINKKTNILLSPILNKGVLSDPVIKINDPKKRQKEIEKFNKLLKNKKNNLYKGIKTKLESKLKPRENVHLKYLEKDNKLNDKIQKTSKKVSKGFNVKKLKQNIIDDNYNKSRKQQERILMKQFSNERLEHIEFLKNFEKLGYLPKYFCERLGYKDNSNEEININLLTSSINFSDTPDVKIFDKLFKLLESSLTSILIAKKTINENENKSRKETFKVIEKLSEFFNLIMTYPLLKKSFSSNNNIKELKKLNKEKVDSLDIKEYKIKLKFIESLIKNLIKDLKTESKNIIKEK